jgi:hypothetical protein
MGRSCMLDRRVRARRPHCGFTPKHSLHTSRHNVVAADTGGSPRFTRSSCIAADARRVTRSTVSHWGVVLFSSSRGYHTLNYKLHRDIMVLAATPCPCSCRPRVWAQHLPSSPNTLYLNLSGVYRSDTERTYFLIFFFLSEGGFPQINHLCLFFHTWFVAEMRLMA